MDAQCESKTNDQALTEWFKTRNLQEFLRVIQVMADHSQGILSVVTRWVQVVGKDEKQERHHVALNGIILQPSIEAYINLRELIGWEEMFKFFAKNVFIPARNYLCPIPYNVMLSHADCLDDLYFAHKTGEEGAGTKWSHILHEFRLSIKYCIPNTCHNQMIIIRPIPKPPQTESESIQVIAA